MAWEHALPTDNGRISVYHAAVPALHRFITYASSPARLLSALLLAPLLCWSLCLAQLTPAYGVTSICRFVQAATALSITQSFFARMPLLSLWLLAFLFVWISSFASATLSTLCFSMSSRQPSSLSGPSPRISTAGAYCGSLLLHPSIRWWFSGTHPCWCLRKVRDSNPRCVHYVLLSITM